MDYFDPENGVPSEIGIHSKDFFKLFHNERGQEVPENYGFS